MNSENKSLIEKYYQKLRNNNIYIVSEIKTLFCVLPHLLLIDNPSAEPIISYLLALMIESNQPEILLDIFTEYILDYIDLCDEKFQKNILSELEKNMSSYRSLSLFYFVDSYCRTSIIEKLCNCTDLLRKKGVELYKKLN